MSTVIDRYTVGLSTRDKLAMGHLSVVLRVDTQNAVSLWEGEISGIAGSSEVA